MDQTPDSPAVETAPAASEEADLLPQPAAAWDRALGAPLRKVTPPALNFFGETLVQLVLFRGRYRGSWAKPDTSALLRLVHHLDRTASEATLGHTVRP